MPKKLFSIQYTSYNFEQIDIVSISTNFDESQVVNNINSLLREHNLIYRGEITSLSFSYNGEKGLIIGGIAEEFNPNASAFKIY